MAREFVDQPPMFIREIKPSSFASQPLGEDSAAAELGSYGFRLKLQVGTARLKKNINPFGKLSDVHLADSLLVAEGESCLRNHGWNRVRALGPGVFLLFSGHSHDLPPEFVVRHDASTERVHLLAQGRGDLGGVEAGTGNSREISQPVIEEEQLEFLGDFLPSSLPQGGVPGGKGVAARRIRQFAEDLSSVRSPR